MNIKRTPIALAISALFVAPLALAQSESYSVTVNNSGSIAIDSTSTSETVQKTRAIVDLNLTSKAQAVVDDKQLGTTNTVTNYAHDNEASIGGTAGGGAHGNIGVNTAAGDNNMQDNAASIAAADAYFVFGAAESRAMTTQLSTQNVAVSVGSNNRAVVDGGFAGAGGNIGVNVAAGNGNMQKNNLAVASAPSRVSVASVQNVQSSKNNTSVSSGLVEQVNNTVQVNLTGGVSGSYSGTASGTTAGQSDQIGDVYPDVWSGAEPHPSATASQIAHIDLDSEAQGAQDLNNDGGALAFNNEGTYAGTEAGTASLSGAFSGEVITTSTIVHQSNNNAHLRGDSLNGASGNIGVNIASGNGNLQNNSLSMAVAHAPVAPPTLGELPTTGGGELFR